MFRSQALEKATCKNIGLVRSLIFLFSLIKLDFTPDLDVYLTHGRWSLFRDLTWIFMQEKRNSRDRIYGFSKLFVSFRVGVPQPSDDGLVSTLCGLSPSRPPLCFRSKPVKPVRGGGGGAVPSPPLVLRQPLAGGGRPFASPHPPILGLHGGSLSPPATAAAGSTPS